jgi:glyoxylase-like metal-dependent hydrolase (beta-lactamase superfamily II)
LAEIRPGLLRWLAAHPDWEPDAEPDSPADWPQDVGCILHEAPAATVLIDPLVPDDLWPELDARVRGRGLPVRVLTTIRWHRRSRDDVLARYSGSEEAVAGVEAIPLVGLGETLYWIAEHRALVAGDRLIGTPGGGVRPCPESWLHDDDGATGSTAEELRQALLPLLELPIDLVLVSHGEPVLARGRDALAAVL